jgi:hypothetical protein
MLDVIDNEMHLNGNGSQSKKKILKLATIFHDAVYVPMSETNEEDSVALYIRCNPLLKAVINGTQLTQRLGI